MRNCNIFLSRLQVCGSEGLPIRVTYFVPDEKKEGGAYQEYTGSLKRLDAYARALIFLAMLQRFLFRRRL